MSVVFANSAYLASQQHGPIPETNPSTLQLYNAYKMSLQMHIFNLLYNTLNFQGVIKDSCSVFQVLENANLRIIYCDLHILLLTLTKSFF